MEKIKEKVKLATLGRKVSEDTVAFFKLPEKAKYLLKSYIRNYDDPIKYKYYNGGGDLVNYGLNTFVKDIYFINNHVIFSDRFGNYNFIKDKQNSEVMANSTTCISPEGIILFYNENLIYATLNCKVGCIIEISCIVPKKEKYVIDEIIISNKRTYLKVYSDKNKKDILYYSLFFSFNFYESYGTQIYMRYDKLKEKYIEYIEDNELSKEISDFTVDTIQRSEEMLTLHSTSIDYTSDNFIEKFDKNFFCEGKEFLESKVAIKLFSYHGDDGINNCINSFIKEIYTMSPIIYKKSGIFKKPELVSVKRTIAIYDRFGKSYMQSYEKDQTISYIPNSSLFVSQEGVLVALVTFNYDVFILVSLDGIVWKKYNMKNIFDDISISSSNVQIKQKDNKMCICSYKNCYSKDEQSFEIAIDFSFNFWDLYSAPVEATFTLIEYL